jgi:asparagine synthase (glutamine-hydrolysing)
MLRYIAAIWNDSDRAQRDVAEQLARALRERGDGWKVVLQSPGLNVYCAGVRPGASEFCCMTDGAGVVVGTLFDRRPSSAPRARTSLDAAETQRLISTRGADLVRSYWGRYVAFLRDPTDSTQRVVREPSGAMPCFVTRYRGLHVYFSALADVAALDGLQLTTNWRYVAAVLSTFVADTHQTGFNEVSKVVGGECLEHDGDATRHRALWDPCEIAATNVLEDFESAARDLRQAVSSSVHAWASCYDGIVHSLSGGLDSSIVLGCLQNAPNAPRLTCLNWYYVDAANSDERKFARLAAAQAGCRVVERQTDPHFSIEGILRVGPSCVPYDHTLVQGVSKALAQIVRSSGSSAIFTGNGGDQLFYKFPNQFSCADYLRRHGVTPRLLRVALDTARLRRTSMLQVLRTSFRDAFLRKPLEAALADCQVTSLVAPDVAREVMADRRFLHPWLASCDSLPPGKAFHLMTLSYPFEMTYDSSQTHDAAEIDPLFSQPVIESCLRTPTYVLTHNGWDRAVARRAFAGDIPIEILRRRSKCVPEEYGKRVVAHNIVFIRELLMDGVLVNQGLIDRSKLETALCGGATNSAGDPADIMKIASTEAWLHTQPRTQRRVAA